MRLVARQTLVRRSEFFLRDSHGVYLNQVIVSLLQANARCQVYLSLEAVTRMIVHVSRRVWRNGSKINQSLSD